MTKAELSTLLHKLGIPIDEWNVSDKNINKYPRITYWPFLDEDISASGESYKLQRTYQISFMSDIPDHPKIKELRCILNKENLHPKIYHEYVKEDKVFHSYLSLDVIEDE